MSWAIDAPLRHELFLLCRHRLIDPYCLLTQAQITTLASTELSGYRPEEQFALLVVRRKI